MIEIDRIHRPVGPRNPNPAFSRDVISRIHFLNIKADIMQAARSQDSKQTLLMREALRPVRDAPQAKQIKYRSGFRSNSQHLTMANRLTSACLETWLTFWELLNDPKYMCRTGLYNQRLPASLITGWETFRKRHVIAQMHPNPLLDKKLLPPPPTAAGVTISFLFLYPGLRERREWPTFFPGHLTQTPGIWRTWQLPRPP